MKSGEDICRRKCPFTNMRIVRSPSLICSFMNHDTNMICLKLNYQRIFWSSNHLQTFFSRRLLDNEVGWSSTLLRMVQLLQYRYYKSSCQMFLKHRALSWNEPVLTPNTHPCHTMYSNPDDHQIVLSLSWDMGHINLKA